jgi:negative regulator of sigma E activity
MFLLCSFPVFADDAELAEQVRYKEEVLQTLKNEIQQIDSEMARCEKAKKGWVAATVVGGVGVAATGAAAIAQGVKISQKKKAAAEPKEEKK